MLNVKKGCIHFVNKYHLFLIHIILALTVQR